MVCGLFSRPVQKRKRRPAAGEVRDKLGRGPLVGSGCLQRLRRLFWLRGAIGRDRLKIVSPLPGTVQKEVAVDAEGSWSTFCPVCKRPIELEAAPAPPREPQPPNRGRFAYVVALWGENPSYILGSMVLGKSLRATGTRHELVVLHTDSVPVDALQWLSRSGWKLHRTDVVWGVKQLYAHGEPRFQGVFTKLQALGLVEYEKILLLDIDTLALGTMDSLFELPAPAAMGRGPQDAVEHGDPIDGSSFFSGFRHFNPWGQSWGINAGVMLMRPDEEELRQMLSEVTDPSNPSHVKGNGPEQDYLSRYWADRWTHIGVEYNFQMHQMYHVLHPRGFTDRRAILMTQFLRDPEKSGIHLMHYSGPVKPWSKFLDKWYREDRKEDLVEDLNTRFVRDVLEAFNGYWLWVRQDPDTVRQQGLREGITFGPTGKLHWIDWGKQEGDTSGHELAGAAADDRDASGEPPPPCGSSPYGGDGGAQAEPLPPAGEEVDIPEDLVRSAELIVTKAHEWWDEAYWALAAELGSSDLGAEVARACAGARREENGCSRGGGHPQAAAERPGDAGEKVGWSNSGGWWVQRPVRSRASALAGCSPEPFVTLSLRCSQLLDLRGHAAVGLHALALREDGGAVDKLSCDAPAWVARLPPGALVFVAVVGAVPQAALELLEALRCGGCTGVPEAPPPVGCTVLVAVGRKGAAGPFETMAAADFALATLTLDSADEERATAS